MMIAMLTGDINVKIALKPLRDLFFGERDSTEKSGSNGGADGAIINGCATVLVGG